MDHDPTTGRSSNRTLGILNRVIGSGVNQVTSIQPKGEGGFVLDCGDDVRLRVYTPRHGEWRLFAPTDSWHFVLQRSKELRHHGALLVDGVAVQVDR